jgi:hypothetical protein
MNQVTMLVKINLENYLNNIGKTSIIIKKRAK